VDYTKRLIAVNSDIKTCAFITLGNVEITIYTIINLKYKMKLYLCFGFRICICVREVERLKRVRKSFVYKEVEIINNLIISRCGPGSSVGIATGYGLDGPGIESRWGARFSAPIQTDPGAHPASCTMGTGSFPGVESGRGVTLTPHPLLVPRSKNRLELYLYSP
jgi:hypothetical protein